MILSARYGAVAASLPAGGGAEAYTLIDSVTLTGNSTSITFSSISQDYTHLLMQGYLLTQNTSTSPYIRVNGLSTGIYRFSGQRQDNGTAQGYSANPSSNIYFYPVSTWGANLVGSCKIQFFNYSNTSNYKPVIFETGGTATSSYHTQRGFAHIETQSAISSITFTGGWAATTKIDLYGIVGAS